MAAGMQASLKQSRPKREFSIRIRSWKLSLLRPGRGAPSCGWKGFPNAPAMHLLTHPPRHGAYRESMWNHVNPPCMPLHHWVYTINMCINSNFLTNFYQPLSWLFEQFQLLSLTGHSASPKNSCFPGNGLSDSRRQPTSCHELDVSPKRDAVLFFFFFGGGLSELYFQLAAGNSGQQHEISNKKNE